MEDLVEKLTRNATCALVVAGLTLPAFGSCSKGIMYEEPINLGGQVYYVSAAIGRDEGRYLDLKDFSKEERTHDNTQAIGGVDRDNDGKFDYIESTLDKGHKLEAYANSDSLNAIWNREVPSKYKTIK